MIKSFQVKGFRGFKDWITLDLSSINRYEFNQECVKDGLVKVGLVYGHNGVGKSNLGMAMLDIINHLTDKHTDKPSYQNYHYANRSEQLVEFVYVFQIDEHIIEYAYGKLSIDDIIYEKLVIDNKTVIAFDRRNTTGLSVALEGTSSLNRNIGEPKISVVKYVKSNSILPETEENELFTKFINFVENMLMFWSLEYRQFLGYESSVTDMFQDIVEKGHVEDFKNFLKSAGLKNNLKVVETNKKVQFVYEFGSKSIDFFTLTSAGTHALTLFYYWYQRMIDDSVKPSFIFIDEYDAFYHSELATEVVSLLKKLDIQVILTTHNTSLMTNDLMRPDCCFLMWENSITQLSKLTDRELREAHNIEKMYKAGLFNAQ